MMLSDVKDLPQKVRITQVCTRNRSRLLALGFIPGTIIEIVRQTSFGGPLLIIVRGTNVLLRAVPASLIEVELL